MNRTLQMLPLVVVACGSLAHAQSDTYPSKPVTVVVAQTAGGPNDKEARLYLNKMQASLGQPFVLDFKPGAAGMVGTSYVARSVPDGYTILQTAGAFTIIPSLSAQSSYDPVRDFAPISLMSKKPAVLMVNISFPANSFREYIDYARTNPGKLNVGTAGQGSTAHLVSAWMHSATNTSVTFVPYKGVAPILPDLFTGRVHATVVTTLVANPLLKSGKVKVLAITDEKRSSLMPAVPTVAEQGIPGFNYTNWLGFMAPAATPGAIVAKLSSEFGRIAKAPDIIAAQQAVGVVMVGSTPMQFRQLLTTESAHWKKLVKETGIKKDS